MAPSSRNTTNQERIARALNRSTGCGYQKALQRVKAAADAGRLPAKLDQAGREEAVRMLAKDHSWHGPVPVAVASGPSAGTHPPAVTLGPDRGGPAETVADAGAPDRQGHQGPAVDPGDLPGSFTASMLETQRSLAALRSLREKERVVAAMRAERDRGSPPHLLPAVSQKVVEQVELLLEQTRPLPWSDEPR
ncbi:hypothetical protein OG948_60275 (plasmid) [Embleya sp. NBC_00888]|uniref:hypothetical protein n=1 Tax=Embleya sp. NBC_00888 TaxID=2975960 RepID=UPI00386B8981|nr:hypothetical protein OG948_60275 [Embleya sp. NBC_00888]